MSAHFKFRCGACGQRIAVNPEDYGTKANCPTCGSALTVPTPSAPPELLARLEAEGITFRPSRLLGAYPDLRTAVETHTRLLEEFFDELAALWHLVERLVSERQFSREPSQAELQAVAKALFGKVIDGEWDRTEDDLQALLFGTLPAIRS